MLKDRVPADTEGAAGVAIFLVEFGGVADDLVAAVTGEAGGMKVLAQGSDTPLGDGELAPGTFWGAGVADGLALHDQEIRGFHPPGAHLADEAGWVPQGVGKSEGAGVLLNHLTAAGGRRASSREEGKREGRVSIGCGVNGWKLRRYDTRCSGECHRRPLPGHPQEGGPRRRRRQGRGSRHRPSQSPPWQAAPVSSAWSTEVLLPPLGPLGSGLLQQKEKDDDDDGEMMVMVMQRV